MGIREEIIEYCELNGIDDVDGFMDYLLTKAFSVEKYGNVPQPLRKKTVEESSSEETHKEKPQTKCKRTVKKADEEEKKVSPKRGIKIVKKDKIEEGM